jgi:hypothetical protein
MALQVHEASIPLDQLKKKPACHINQIQLFVRPNYFVMTIASKEKKFGRVQYIDTNLNP